MDERKQFISRMGTFFLLIGIFLMMLFIITDLAGATDFLFFFASAITLVTGWYFKRATAIPRSQQSNGRFMGIRRWRQRMAENKAKREAKKKEREEKKKQKQQAKKKK